MSLLKLPNELLEAIANFTEDYAGLAGLARACTRLEPIANHILWQRGVDDAEAHTKMTGRAAEAGNLDALKKAVTYGADLEKMHPVPIPEEILEKEGPEDLCARYVTEDQMSYILWGAPLHLAVYNGHHPVVEWLISQGVDLDAPGHLYCDCKSMCGYLTEYDTYPSVFDHPYWTSLHYAICRQSFPIMQLLLSAGASTRTQIGGSEIEVDHRFSRILQGQGRHNNRLDYAYINPSRVAALHTASELGPKSLVTYLIVDQHMDVNVKDDEGYTPLFYAMLCPDETMMGHLISLGADTEAVADEGDNDADASPLGVAIAWGLWPAVDKLLGLGFKTWRGNPKTPCVYNGLGLDRNYLRLINVTIAEYLQDSDRSSYGDISLQLRAAFMDAVRLDTFGTSILQSMLEAGFRLDSTIYGASIGSEALRMAAGALSFSLLAPAKIRFLLQHGVDPTEAYHRSGYSPLGRALIAMVKRVTEDRSSTSAASPELLGGMIQAVNDLSLHPKIWDPPTFEKKIALYRELGKLIGEQSKASPCRKSQLKASLTVPHDWEKTLEGYEPQNSTIREILYARQRYLHF